jgi:hypothetical protein
MPCPSPGNRGARCYARARRKRDALFSGRRNLAQGLSENTFHPLGGTRTGVVLSPAKSHSTGSGCGFRTVRRAEAWDSSASACSRSANVGDFPGEADGYPGEATFVEGEASAAGVERVAPRALLPAAGKPCSPHRNARGATRSTVHPAPLTSSLASTLSLKPLLPTNPGGTGRGCEIRTVRRPEARDYFASACSHSARTA